MAETSIATIVPARVGFRRGKVSPPALAYLAGMIDGDGYVTIARAFRGGRYYHTPQVGIAGTRSEPHEFAALLWGGAVNRYVPKNPLHRPQYQWCRCGTPAAVIIEAIRPYLLVKAEQADLALELWEHLEFGRCEDPFPWFGPDYDPIPERDRMREEMIALNQSRNRLRKKAAGRLLDGVVHEGMPEVRHGR